MAEVADDQEDAPRYVRACFVCRSSLEAAGPLTGIDPGEVPLQSPLGGMTWKSYGGIGSGVFDPVCPVTGQREKPFLQIIICDRCVIERSELIVRVRERAKITRHARRWDPGKDRK